MTAPFTVVPGLLLAVLQLQCSWQSCQNQVTPDRRWSPHVPNKLLLATRQAGDGAAVVEISMAPQSRERLVYLYAAVAAEEVSIRVLNLTQQVRRPPLVLSAQASPIFRAACAHVTDISAIFDLISFREASARAGARVLGVVNKGEAGVRWGPHQATKFEKQNHAASQAQLPELNRCPQEPTHFPFAWDVTSS